METKQITLGDLRITGYKSDYILKTIESTGDFYEGPLLKKWTPFFQNAEYILDIGANLGNHTLFWATHLPAKRIISFEPFPANYAILSQNINNNSLFCVQAIQMAVSDHTGILSVKEFTDSNYGATTFEHNDSAENAENTVPARSIDSIFQQLNLSRVDFVKIDTEGFEMAVLNGMMSVIDRFKPFLWIELCEETVADVYRTLSDKGYQLLDVSGANTLFAPPEADADYRIDLPDLLVQNIFHLAKANRYYANYETAKQWLNNKNAVLEQANARNSQLRDALADITGRKQELDEALEQANKRNSQLKDALADITGRKQELDKALEQEKQASALLEKKYAKSAANYETCKGWLNARNQAYTALQEENGKLKEKLQQKRKLLADSEHLLEEEEAFLISLQKEVHSLNRQLRQAKWKAIRYDALHKRLTGSWYGKIALKGYRVLKKIKALVKK